MKKTVVLVLMVIAVLVGASLNLAAAPVPDTGQTKCYNDTGEIPCPSEGEPWYGQDGNYTINAPSYTKLGYNDVVLLDDATYPEWIMTRDNVTGLIWEMKTDDNFNSIHYAWHPFTWYDSNPETNGGYAGTPGNGTDTEDFIKNLNDNSFGGKTGWRLPTIQELASIVKYSIPYPGPTIETGFFPHTLTPDYAYWSRSTCAPYISEAWKVNFASGDVSHIYKSSNFWARYVRAVRGGQYGSFGSSILPTGLNRYTTIGDDVVTDAVTGLMWEKNTPDNTMTWTNALAYCHNNDLGGFTDWRLPTINELHSLVDYGRYNKSINPEFFPDTSFFSYWSSTTLAGDTSRARDVSFDYGLDLNSIKSYSNYVRAIRGGQNRLFDHLFISAPVQAEFLPIGAGMDIQWEKQQIEGNVAIRLSRDGGKSWEDITLSTPNSGSHPWTVTGPESVHCMLKIEPINDPSKGTVQGFTIYESESPVCTYGIDPPSKTFAGAGGSQEVMVTASSATCSWSVTENLDWITVSRIGDTGSGSVTVTASQNTGAARSGTVNIAGRCFSVNQGVDIPGDVNGDGNVTMTDAMLTTQYVNGLLNSTTIDSLILDNADVDGNGDVDLNDAYAIASYVGEFGGTLLAPESAALAITSVSQASAQPGEIITITTDASLETQQGIAVMFGTMEIPPVSLVGKKLTVIVPILPAGTYDIRIRTHSAVGPTRSFTITELGPAQLSLAELQACLDDGVSKMVTSTHQMIMDAGLFNSTQQAELNTVLNGYLNLLDTVRTDLSSLSEEERRVLERILDNAGLLAIFQDLGVATSASSHVSDTSSIWTNNLCLQLDTASFFLGNIEAVIGPISFLATVTGHVAVGVLLHEIKTVLFFIKGFIDAVLPTDMNDNSLKATLDNTTITSEQKTNFRSTGDFSQQSNLASYTWEALV
ncbi:MAG: DUF1566 domain-containing protein, partial [Desulfatirhabdiaceae bacterium]